MPETLTAEDGKPIPLDDTDSRFAAAMAAPRGDEPEHPAPPEREPVDPEAPFGRKLDGTPKKRAGGRPPTRPREITAPPAAASSPPRAPSPAGPASTPDFTAGLTEFTEALWMVLAATPVPWDEIRIRVRCQAWVLSANQGGLVRGVNIMAQHNATIRAGVERVTAGSAGWVLPAVMALAPFAVQTAMIWRAPPNGDMADLAAATEAAWTQQFASMKAEFEAEMSAAGFDETGPAAAAAAGDGPASAPAAAA